MVSLLNAPDYDHGASVVAGRMAGELGRLALSEALPAAVSILAAHPELASLYPLLDLTVTATANGTPDESWRERLARHGALIAEEGRRTAETAVSIIIAAEPRQLVVISQSGTVCMVLDCLALRGFLIPVLCAESRPRLEGRQTAVWAYQRGFPVTLCVDAAVRAHTEVGAIAVVGCDRLGARAFRNKVGSWAVATAVRHRHGRVLLVATSDKVVDPRIPWPGCRRHDPSEVWDAAPEGITTVNTYFEDVPIEPGTEVCIGRSHCPGVDWPGRCELPTYYPDTVEIITRALGSTT